MAHRTSGGLCAWPGGGMGVCASKSVREAERARTHEQFVAKASATAAPPEARPAAAAAGPIDGYESDEDEPDVSESGSEYEYVEVDKADVLDTDVPIDPATVMFEYVDEDEDESEEVEEEVESEEVEEEVEEDVSEPVATDDAATSPMHEYDVAPGGALILDDAEAPYAPSGTPIETEAATAVRLSDADVAAAAAAITAGALASALSSHVADDTPSEPTPEAHVSPTKLEVRTSPPEPPLLAGMTLPLSLPRPEPADVEGVRTVAADAAASIESPPPPLEKPPPVRKAAPVASHRIPAKRARTKDIDTMSVASSSVAGAKDFTVVLWRNADVHDLEGTTIPRIRKSFRRMEQFLVAATNAFSRDGRPPPPAFAGAGIVKVFTPGGRRITNLDQLAEGSRHFVACGTEPFMPAKLPPGLRSHLAAP